MSNITRPTVPALGGEQSLNRYLSEIKKFPVLTAEQEYMLAKRYQEHEDPDAAAFGGRKGAAGCELRLRRSSRRAADGRARSIGRRSEFRQLV